MAEELLWKVWLRATCYGINGEPSLRCCACPIRTHDFAYVIITACVPNLLRFSLVCRLRYWKLTEVSEILRCNILSVFHMDLQTLICLLRERVSCMHYWSVQMSALHESVQLHV